MKTRRSKARARQITPEVLDAFRRLRAAETQAAWWAAHGELHRELRAKPHQWPCVEEPTGVRRNYEPDPEALALWHELEAAADG